MNDLSKKQYKMLCEIKKRGGIFNRPLSTEEKEICKYLSKLGCLYFITTPSSKKTVQLTQFGETQIYAFRSTFYKWWIPVIISMLAAIGAYREELLTVGRALLQLLM